VSERGPAYGFDIGGTSARVAVVDAGRVVGSETVRTGRDRAPADVAADLTAAARAVAESTGLAPVVGGAGVAGQVHADDRRLAFAPNLGWHDVALAELLEAGLGVTVHLLNDVQAAALAEATHGPPGRSGDVLVVYVGTGVGGGIVADGRLRRGCSGSAGEIGHITIVHGGRHCRCGSRGCLEAYAGGWAISERAREAVLADPAAGIALERAATSDDVITARAIAEAAAAGDGLARWLIEETANYLASGIASMINVLNPCAVVLGGGVTRHMTGLVERTRDLALSRALPLPAGSVKIRPAVMGDDAGMIGAAYWALQRAGDAVTSEPIADGPVADG
jgi:glucokinase